MPLPDDAVAVSADGRQLTVVAQDLALLDDVVRPVPTTVPATVSFRIEWRGTKGQKRRGRGLKVPPTNSAAFIGRFRRAKATATFSGGIDGFSFQSDPNVPTKSIWALVGTERNGVFLSEEASCGACAPGLRPPSRGAGPR
jgi:hypothetical protein